MNSTTTTDENSPWKVSEFVEIILIFMYFLITFIALSGNGIVCYLVLAYKRMHTVPNYFIFNLAVSDILVAIFCIPFSFVANLKNYWPFGVAMCPIVMYSQVVTVFLSSYTLVAMSIDRYVVIVHPFLRRITTRQTVFVILAIWVISLAIPLPTLLHSQILYFSNTSGQCLEIWESDLEKSRYSLALMILHYFAPLAILIFSYSKIGYNIWIKNFRNDEGNKRRLQLAAAKQKVSMLSLIIFVIFSLCMILMYLCCNWITLQFILIQIGLIFAKS
ncbi:hypothetical protein LOTGIDRAFT_127919 [Lottia gigantea]|uniref:G-protein coupled receptors family 1 profile domain-containing protein n=1 Tax=Lottia gigantea TaxID=225164 RepID=V4BF32_LOTGI|nr:hypothetical protein LOTGIDRAFT_127919 [Lottia gigantea]ESO87474.1 hypothetical protein LOTGIDRAFT_127919 [Lottia gigantea]